MSPATLPDKPACLAPELGRKLTDSLGQLVPMELFVHLDECLACQLERAAFERLEELAVTPSAAFERRMRTAIVATRNGRAETDEPL